jgi:hypothetical protein
METIKLTVNVLANLTLFTSALMFYIYIFGDEDKAVAKLNITKLFLLRVGVISIICGSFFNAVTLWNPPLPEVVLNVGLAVLFYWAYDFHKKIFKRK